ncbi:DUF4129 domain-containing protein [Cytophagaceae bacterium DM2B3-1]|uniref:DUF4129 domain-containing protein n=1 Tax=Xanthocytophaga flava TaxID=3048013 RepID=A0AAE3QND9_9BACT|nr:DUF4129 domain-containing protein [Xanthocytophaga flavus]MDJ1480101.1 DUF4129 domain-containing protein [Xanthocytophaga flavus]MDJ1495663.1 DUF4129 domain-containing protein [Xanthocytophaga flavus]
MRKNNNPKFQNRFFKQTSSILCRGLFVGSVFLSTLNLQAQDTTIVKDAVVDSVAIPATEEDNPISVHERQQWRPVVAEPQLQEAKLRKFDPDKLSDFVNNSDYQYDIKQPADRLSWWERFKAWLSELLNDLFRGYGKIPGGDRTIKIIVIVISAGLLIFALIKFIGADPRSWFKRSAKTDELSLEDIENDIHSISFDEMIADAVAKQQHKRAIRLFYLKSLKQLSDRDWIDWQPYKTNYEYVKELKKNELLGDFKQLTYLFEYIWYGDFQLDAVSFKEAEQRFSGFEQKMRIM